MENTQILRIDLTHRPRLRGLLRSRWPQFALRAIGLAGLVLVILTGWFGSPVGSQNFAIMLVWIGWWTALKLVLLPFGGRSWCSICPIPMPGDWLQQGWLVRPGGKGLNRGRRWPRRLRNTWLQAAGFAAIGLFSAVTLTTPVVTAWVFFGLIAAALVVSLVFEQRSFCRYLCPMGGFIGTYAVLAPIELRPQPDSAARYQAARDWPRGCPWINNPAALKANTNCGLCLECLRTPSGDTMSLNLRPFDLELSQPNPSGWMKPPVVNPPQQRAGVHRSVPGPLGLAQTSCIFCRITVLVVIRGRIPAGLLRPASWSAGGRLRSSPASGRAHRLAARGIFAVQPGAAAARYARLDRIHCVLLLRQAGLPVAGAVRPIWLGLEPVRDSWNRLAAISDGLNPGARKPFGWSWAGLVAQKYPTNRYPAWNS